MGVDTEYRSDDKIAVPSKVIVRCAGEDEGGYVLADGLFMYDFRWVPFMWIGHGQVSREIPAISDQWVILHELAHIWDAQTPGHHLKSFTKAFLSLVDFRLGKEAAQILKEALIKPKI
jgi:hypothetical protein